MDNVRYLVAANLSYGKRLIAAAVVYAASTEEPSFVYTLNGRQRTSFLYRRGDKIPPALRTSLDAYIRGNAVSWALVTAHPLCPPDAALKLAVIRAMERWVCRQATLPSLAETCILLPTRKPLLDLPSTLKQITHAKKDWHIAAAGALCRHRAAQE